METPPGLENSSARQRSAAHVQTNGTECMRGARRQVGVGLTQPAYAVAVLGDGWRPQVSTRRRGAITFFPPDGFAWFHIDNGPGGGRPIGRLRISHGDTRRPSC